MTRRTPLLAATFVTLAVIVGCQPGGPQISRAPVAPPPPVAAPIVAEPDYWPTFHWRSSTPEQQGVDSAKLAAMFDAIDPEQLNLHSVLIVRNGYVITEAYFYDVAVPADCATARGAESHAVAGLRLHRVGAKTPGGRSAAADRGATTYPRGHGAQHSADESRVTT